jgi:DNA-binding MurR/RpiR family transcriptional regulator
MQAIWLDVPARGEHESIMTTIRDVARSAQVSVATVGRPAY